MSERRDIVIEVDADTRKARSAINDVFRIGRDAMNLAEDFGIKIDEQTKKLFNTLDDARRMIIDLTRLAGLLGGGGGIGGAARGGFTGSASMISIGAGPVVAGGLTASFLSGQNWQQRAAEMGATPEKQGVAWLVGATPVGMTISFFELVGQGWVALLKALGFGGP